MPIRRYTGRLTTEKPPGSDSTDPPDSKDIDSSDDFLRAIAKTPEREPPQAESATPLHIAHFAIDARLGEGGMADVWAATDVRDGSRVALKRLKSHLASQTEQRRRLLREARAAMAIDHPNVARVYEVIEENGAPLIVMELLVGETLRSRLTRGPLSLSDLARTLLPAISAIGTAHALGIVHRDLKPENLFLVAGKDEQPGVTKVLDFGIAKLTSHEGPAAKTTGALTDTGAVMGTPLYMSPEQIFGESDVDHRSDIWSLGVIFYECLTGRPAFAGDNLGQLIKAISKGEYPRLRDAAPQLPPALTTLVDAMLSLDRAMRPQDLRETANVLRAFTDAESPLFSAPTIAVANADPPPIAPPPVATSSPKSRSTFRRGAEAAGALLLLGALALGVTRAVASKTNATSADAAIALDAGGEPGVNEPLTYAALPAESKNGEAASAFRRGVAALERNEIAIARRELDEAIARDPGFGGAYLQRVFLELSMEAPNTDALAKAFTGATEHAPSLSARDRELLEALAPAVQGPRDWAASETRLGGFVRARPLDAEGWNALGNARQRQGKFTLAIVAFVREIELDPDSQLGRSSKRQCEGRGRP